VRHLMWCTRWVVSLVCLTRRWPTHAWRDLVSRSCSYAFARGTLWLFFLENLVALMLLGCCRW